MITVGLLVNPLKHHHDVYDCCKSCEGERWAPPTIFACHFCPAHSSWAVPSIRFMSTRPPCVLEETDSEALTTKPPWSITRHICGKSDVKKSSLKQMIRRFLCCWRRL